MPIEAALSCREAVGAAERRRTGSQDRATASRSRTIPSTATTLGGGMSDIIVTKTPDDHCQPVEVPFRLAAHDLTWSISLRTAVFG
jgi:hypothetical protein